MPSVVKPLPFPRSPWDKDPYSSDDVQTILDYDREHAPRACAKWCKKDLAELTIEDMKDFAIWLGYPFHNSERSRIIPTFLPEVREKLDMINGPHGETIIKAMDARKQAGEEM